MAFIDAVLAAVASPGGLKEVLGAALNRCEVGACAGNRNLSMGMVCAQCERFCCNAHGFIPLSAVPLMVRAKRPVVVCLGCLMLRADEETP